MTTLTFARAWARVVFMASLGACFAFQILDGRPAFGASIYNLKYSNITSSSADITFDSSVVGEAQVIYGYSKKRLSFSTPWDGVKAQSHKVTLTQLDPNTIWYFRARFRDASGAITTSSLLNFRTAPLAASSPTPIVSNVASSSISASSALVTFNSNVPAYSRVVFGYFDNVQDMSTPWSTSLATSQKVSMTNLDPNTVWYIRAEIKDSNGVVASSAVTYFRTLSAATPTPTPAPAPSAGSSSTTSGPARAFPEAEGYAAVTPGGRGGRIIEVTNLNDSGPGSLREALQASGPRIVVFRVGGIITLKSHIYIANPYLTIAGQTAPGGGILIRGDKSASPSSMHSLFYIETHDVVVRYLRFRLGYMPNFTTLQGKDVILADNCSNIIFDHTSMSWAQDKNFSMWAFSTGTRNVTMQWSIVSEPIFAASDGGTGAIFGADSSALSANTINIDVHHNFFASNRHRNPLFKGKNTQVVNNIVYNWDSFSTGWEGGATIDIVANKYKPGPVNSSAYREIAYRPDGDRAVVGDPSIYIAGNTGPSNSNPDNDNWPMIEVRPTWKGTGLSPSPTLRRYSRQPAAAAPITEQSVGALEGLILPDVGASRRLSEDGTWVSNRDSVDARVVSEYSSGGGKLISSETQVGGYPAIAAGTAPADSDHDGMPDAWELSHGFNPNDASDANKDADGDGYTNVEEYLNGSLPR